MNDAFETKDTVVNLLQRYGFWVILISYLGLQFFHLGYRWVDDESWYLMPLPSIFDEGSFRIPTLPGNEVFWPQPPLLTYMQAAFSKIVPLTSFTARLIPLAFAVGLLFVTFSLCKRHFGFAVALLATLYVAADNILFLTARTVRPDIFAGAIQVFALYAFLRFAHERHAGWLVAAGVLAAIGVSSHPNSLVIPVSLFFCSLILIESWPEKIRSLFIWGIAFGVCLLPFIGWMLWMDYDNNFENVISHWTGSRGRFSGVTEDMGIFSKILALISAEVKGRYLDFIQWPFRIHIGIAAVAAIIAGLASKNKIILTLSIIIIFHLFFYIFINNSNNSVRYLASALPLLAILFGYWTSFLFQQNQTILSGKTLAGFTLVTIIGGSQFAGNLLYHWKFKSADYNQVIADLREDIPTGSSVYGSMSFWLGFQDTLFIPYMRTNWTDAVDRYQPEFVIMDDRVMMGGWEDGEWRPLREHLLSYMSEHGQLIKEVNNEFYGNLKVYRVTYSINTELQQGPP